MNSFRSQLCEWFHIGVDAVRPETAMRQAFDWPTLEADLKGQVTVLAFGKAALEMAHVALEKIPAKSLASKPLVITTQDNLAAAPDVGDMEVHIAGHPWPDARGAEAAERLIARIKAAGEDDLVLALISGGGSALVPAPTVPLADKIALTDELLASGATIGEMNAVRKHLSRLKGGGLARLAAPARLEAFIISDVVGDDLSTIASGPTVPDPSRFSDVMAVLERYDITPPASVLEQFKAGLSGERAETPKQDDPIFNRSRPHLIATNRHVIEAMSSQAERAGYKTHCETEPVVGEAKHAAKALAMRGLQQVSSPTSMSAKIRLSGGETTVNLRDLAAGTAPGRGGRNQEFALAFALSAEAFNIQQPWVLLSAGTDGRDGPTEAAGAVVDFGTLARIRAAGLAPEQALAAHDAGRALEAAGDLLITGGTGTNVADIQVLATGKP